MFLKCTEVFGHLKYLTFLSSLDIKKVDTKVYDSLVYEDVLLLQITKPHF